MFKFSSFKNKYRNRYYYIRSFYEIYIRYIFINFIKIIILPFAILFIPFLIIIKKKGYLFITDIMSGVGHIIPEFDYFYLNQNKNGKIKYIFINNGNSNYKFLEKIYVFDKIYSGNLFLLLVTAINFFNKSKVKCSQTLPDHNMPLNFFSKYYKKNFYFKYYDNYFKLREQNKSFFYIKKNYFEINNKFLNYQKIACIHFRENISHSIPTISNSSNYLKTLEYLLNENYYIIFVGRERMPIEFKNFSILNYAESNEVSLLNDFKIFYASNISIICGSGISYIPDTLEKKYLYINSWHISRPGGYGNQSIVLPSLINKIDENKILSFKEQMILENSGNHLSSHYLNKNKYQLVYPTDINILNATKELINLDENTKLNSQQIKFINNYKNYGFLKNSKARISASFLDQYSKLFD